MGLFQCQDQHRHNSRDVDWNNASGARGNEHEAREEQQVQDGGHSVSDGVHKEPQIQDCSLDRAEEANRDVSEECLQDDKVSTQACDGEFPEHHSLETIFFNPEPDTESKWQPHEAISADSRSFSARSQKMKLFLRMLSETQVFPLINNFASPAVNPPILAADKVQNSKNVTEGDNYIKAIQDNNCIFSYGKIMG